MMDEILCTNCGTPNRRDQEVCSFCQSPLQPIASKDRLRPGLAPTEKSTSELEPLLPDWLRQAREAARSTAPEAPKEPPPEPTIPEPASSPDLPDWLAGLEAISQEEEEELPDWLRGELASPPTEATPPGLSFQEPVPPAQSLDELGGVAPIAGPATGEEDLMAWLQTSEEETPESFDVTSDWLSRLEGSSALPSDETTVQPSVEEPATPPATGELLDWLNQITAESAPASPTVTTEETPSPDVSPFAVTEGESLDDWFSGLGRAGEPPVSATETGVTAGEPAFDLPDWLKSVTETSAPEGSGRVSVSPEPPSASDWMVSLETRPASTLPPEATSGDVSLPDWLSQFPETATPSDSSATESLPEAGFPAWMQPESAGAGAPPFGAETPSGVEEEAAVPDWLQQAAGAGVPPFGAETPPRVEEEAAIPEWLQQAAGAGVPPFGAETPPRVEEEAAVPEWLQQTAGAGAPPFGAETPPGVEEEAAVPDWLQQAAGAGVPPFGAETPSGVEEEAAVPDWLQQAAGAGVPPFGAETPSGVEEEAAVPDWLQQAAGAGVPPFGAETPPGVEEEAAIPEWLQQAAGAGVPPFGAETPSGVEEEAAVPPDWLGAFASQETPTTPPVVSTEMPHAPAFVFSEEAQPAIEEDLFSLQMPDWLSGITPADEAKTLAEEQVLAEGLAPAELPSWVQAMRPVETVLPGEPAMPVEEGPVEVSGPLAGLRGVLPPIEKIVSSKPRPQGLLLQASEAQQADAQLLEQLLLEEAQSRPIPGSPILASQRTLRWALAAVLLLVVLAVQLLGLRLIPLPMGVPIENERAIRVLDALPTNASVLMVFDYQPALAGEIEAVGVPFVDRLLGLRSPNITALSTSPVGMALAQRFMTHLQRRYPSLDERFIRLGYLPGGAMGIRAFALHPRLALPSDLWQHPTLQSVKQFSDYDAVILLTDQAGIARSWIEQTSDQSQGRFLVVIASTQAAPPIQPYVLSGQVDGLLSGLAVGAAFEASTNSGGPVGAYWDAYQGALLLSAVLILAGGIVSLVEQAREHYPFQKAKP